MHVVRAQALAMAWNNAASLLRTIANATVLTYVCAVHTDRKPDAGQRSLVAKVLNPAQALELR